MNREAEIEAIRNRHAVRQYENRILNRKYWQGCRPESSS